jgi:hypothetical protein
MASKRRVLALVYLLAENPEVCLAGSNKAMVTFGQPDRALRRYRHALAPEIFDALIEACRGAGFSPHVVQASAARGQPDRGRPPRGRTPPTGQPAQASVSGNRLSREREGAALRDPTGERPSIRLPRMRDGGRCPYPIR